MIWQRRLPDNVVLWFECVWCCVCHLPGYENGWWVLRPDCRVPSEEELRSMISPEQVCTYYSTLVSEQRLKVSHTYRQRQTLVRCSVIATHTMAACIWAEPCPHVHIYTKPDIYLYEQQRMFHYYIILKGREMCSRSAKCGRLSLVYI